jgi:ribosomal protein S27E
MTFLKRNCPACGNLTLPVLSRSRKKKRICNDCGAEFIEYTGTGCLIYPIILILGFSSLLFGPAISIPIIPSDVVPFVIFVIFILAFIIPGYFLNATLPLRLSKLQENKNKVLGFRDKIYRFPVVLIILITLSVLALRGCSETFFPRELSELASVRENQLSEFRNVLLAYKEDNDCYPEKLTDLIPKYIESIPREIDPEIIRESNLYAIHYYSDNCDASFGWARCNGPDCGSQFYVEKNEFWHDM